MSEIEQTTEKLENDHENTNSVESESNEKVENDFEKNDGIVRRSDKTQKQRAKDAKTRAIDNFKRGVIDPEFRVVKMQNGKYRTYKRKEPLPETINVNQVPENKPTSQVEAEPLPPQPRIKVKSGEHDPFADVIYYNLSNQVSEQLNKRIDAVNSEIERLRRKNSKLKGKYKQLKQALYVSDEEEEHEEKHEDKHEDKHEPAHEEPQQHEQPQPVQQPSPKLSVYPRRPGRIDFNRFFS